MRILLYILFLTCITPQLIAQLDSSKHPILIITIGPRELDEKELVEGTMGIVRDSSGGLNSTDGAFTDYDGKIGIRYRGNSSREFDKKPYALQLWSNTGEPNAASILGMPADEDWILHAMHIDKSLLRVPFTFNISQKMGHYASRWKYVEVIINGEYEGMYTVVEKIKKAPNRVNIDYLGETDGTGGFILKFDWLDGGGGVSSKYDSQGSTKLKAQYVEPKGREMMQSEKDYLKKWLEDFEDALFSNSFKNNKGEHYTKFIDSETFADFLLINEFSKNSDGYKLSTFMYKDSDQKDGRLKAGPIWDFDQTYGLSVVCSNDNPCGWTFLQNQPGCEDLISMPMWWRALVKDAAFCNLLGERWSLFRNSFLHQDSINSWIDSTEIFIEEARKRNFERWPIISTEVWSHPEPIPETYEGEIELMKEWIDQRLSWLDRNIPSLALQAKSNNSINIFPNPAKHKASIAMLPGNSITVCDAMGRVMLTETECNEGAYNLNVANWAPGCYTVFISSSNGINSGKLVVY